MSTRLPDSTLRKLSRWNTPTIYNGWETLSSHDRLGGFVNLEETRDIMPEMGPMVGYAVTVVVEPGNSRHPQENPEAWDQYRRYVAEIPGPKIVVVQDLDKPATLGSFWGEVNAGAHHALGCVGTITDGAVRDTDEMHAVGFKALARRLCVGHAYSWPVRWNCAVDVFGCTVQPGALIHADKHGFIVIPEDDQERILEAALFMDNNECDTMISASRAVAGRGMSVEQILKRQAQAEERFRARAQDKFHRKAEW